MTTRPTDAELREAADTISRGVGVPKTYTVEQIAEMSDEELDRAGIGPEQMLRIATESGGWIRRS